MAVPDLTTPATSVAKPCLPNQARGVAERAESRLLHNPYLALKTISCEYRDGNLILRGCLPTYYLKQVAQATVASVEGVERIVNLIDVTAPLPREGHEAREVSEVGEVSPL